MSTELASTTPTHVVKAPKRKRGFRFSPLKFGFAFCILVIIALLVENSALRSELEEQHYEAPNENVASLKQLLNNEREERLHLYQKYIKLQEEFNEYKLNHEKSARNPSSNRKTQPETTYEAPAKTIHYASSSAKGQKKTENEKASSSTGENKGSWKDKVTNFFKESANVISSGAKKVFGSLKDQTEKIIPKNVKWEQYKLKRYIQHGMEKLSRNVKEGYKIIKNKFKRK